MSQPSKPTIRVGFIDYFKPIDDFFIDVLSRKYNVVRDDNDPEYLFFCDETFGTNNLRFDPQKVTKILFTGENRRPWQYSAHHAISYDHLDGPHHYRLPLWVVDDWVQVTKFGLKSVLEVEKERMYYPPRDVPNEFCSFIVSNGGCIERNEVFHYVSTYKKVDSGGPLFNNIGYILPRGEDAYVHKFRFMKDRKFNLCYENGSYPGYVTEKLFHALYNRVVPIYWGDPLAWVDFDMQGVVNRHDFNTVEDMIDEINRIDHDDRAYKMMLTSNILTDRGRKVLDLNNLLDWFDRHVYLGDSE